jgi:hypothetical protein
VVELGWLGFIAIVYLAVASVFWLQAPLARLMDDARETRPNAGIRRTLAAIYPRLGSITGGTAVAAIAVFIAAGFFVLPGLLVLGRLALFIPVIVLEGTGAFAAFGRSNRLQHRHGGARDARAGRQHPCDERRLDDCVHDPDERDAMDLHPLRDPVPRARDAAGPAHADPVVLRPRTS